MGTRTDRTATFLDALERRDLDTAVALLAPDVTWTTRMAADGTQRPGVTSGREQVLARLRELGAWFDQVRFTDRRLSVIQKGDVPGESETTFVQTDGDFRTVDGHPYRNVYVFRFDWQDGLLATWEEYANPVTIRQLEEAIHA